MQNLQHARWQRTNLSGCDEDTVSGGSEPFELPGRQAAGQGGAHRVEQDQPPRRIAHDERARSGTGGLRHQLGAERDQPTCLRVYREVKLLSNSFDDLGCTDILRY